MTAWSPRDREGAFKAWHRHSLSLVHLNVLAALEMEGPLSMKRLADAMDVSDASATGIVDRMEKRGLVERRHGTDDRRVVLVHPTDAGADRSSATWPPIAARCSPASWRELTEDEMAALLIGMRAIHAARRRLLDADPDWRRPRTSEAHSSAMRPYASLFRARFTAPSQSAATLTAGPPHATDQPTAELRIAQR